MGTTKIGLLEKCTRKALDLAHTAMEQTPLNDWCGDVPAVIKNWSGDVPTIYIPGTGGLKGNLIKKALESITIMHETSGDRDFVEVTRDNGTTKQKKQNRKSESDVNWNKYLLNDHELLYDGHNKAPTRYFNLVKSEPAVKNAITHTLATNHTEERKLRQRGRKKRKLISVKHIRGKKIGLMYNQKIEVKFKKRANDIIKGKTVILFKRLKRKKNSME